MGFGGENSRRKLLCLKKELLGINGDKKIQNISSEILVILVKIIKSIRIGQPKTLQNQLL